MTKQANAGELSRRGLIAAREDGVGGRVAGQGRSEAIQPRRQFLRGGRGRGRGAGLRAKVAGGHAQGVRQASQHGETLNGLNPALHLRHPALRSSYRRGELALREAAAVPQLGDPVPEDQVLDGHVACSGPTIPLATRSVVKVTSRRPA